MKIVSVIEVLQRSDCIGPRISQVQTVEINGDLYELPIWSDENGETLWHLGEPSRITINGVA